jgi:hypothetical protein
MKNLHLLPTEKPSRLHITGKLMLYPNGLMPKSQGLCKNQHIYITSDEFIEEGDFGLNLSTKNIVQYDGIKGLDSYYKKIILTTDQDLITDGVQAIDDEFLEWFIKNPSCESVVVNFNYKKFRWSELNKSQCYKIIIPQEEPKQETLEEAAANLADPNLCKTDNWIAGAKWQAERMYSEEEVRKIAEEVRWQVPATGNPREFTKNFDKWFEQFKKK